MRFLGRPDATQEAILPHLAATERLLARAAGRAGGGDGDAEVVGLPDLGLPHNVRRIHGGFFTGAYYRWHSEVPFVPVDATVNVCGVALFRVELPDEDVSTFRARVRTAMARAEEITRYVPNYAGGNHFVISATVDGDQEGLPEGRYLVLHASAAEFKKQYNGLYPEPGNWYSDDIEVLEDEDGIRYLRYLRGRAAERFQRIAASLVDYQLERHRVFAELIAGRDAVREEILNVPHYGMPDASSVAIGCQWIDPAAPDYVLLTRPGAPVHLVRATTGGENLVMTDDGERLLTPHGLGVRSEQALELSYVRNALVVNGRSWALTDSMAGSAGIGIRDYEGRVTVDEALANTPGTVRADLIQSAAYHRTGET